MNIRAFTLVELLVVVSIIVTLLALLAPAMDKAVYQAEMAADGSNFRGIGSGVLSYAFDHKRRYPYREHLVKGYSIPIIINNTIYEARYDDRPMLRPYMSINKTLSCPFLPKQDLDDPELDTMIFVPHSLWFSVQYRSDYGIGDMVFENPALGTGMFKIGDRVGWYDNVVGQAVASNVLASSRVAIWQRGEGSMTSHPAEGYSIIRADREWYAIYPKVTVAYFQSLNRLKHEPTDLNTLFDDGSVRRHNAAKWDTRDMDNEERFWRVPGWNNSFGWDHELWENIPKQ
jgi:competence protein ComGC